MSQGYFITGTDTGIGKTWSTVALMQYFKNQGKSVNSPGSLLLP
jgi:dethiobiotin synthetase